MRVSFSKGTIATPAEQSMDRLGGWSVQTGDRVAVGRQSGNWKQANNLGELAAMLGRD